MEDKSEVFDLKKTQVAVNRMIALFAEMGLTIAECCKAAKVLDATFKAEYPEVYRLMNGKQ